MSRHEDELDSSDLSDRQRWAVSRYQARQGRYQRDRHQPTNAEAWDHFHAAERAEENEQIRRGGGHRL